MKFFTMIALVVASVANADDCCLTFSSTCPSGKVHLKDVDTMISGVQYEACCTQGEVKFEVSDLNVCTGSLVDIATTTPATATTATTPSTPDVSDSAAPKDGAIAAAVGVALVGVTILVAV